MCIYSPVPHTLSYCALIGKCALIRSNTVFSLHLCFFVIFIILFVYLSLSNYSFQNKICHTDFENRDIELVTWSKKQDFFSKQILPDTLS